MTNCSRRRCRRVTPGQSAQSASREPPVKRWPHPIACAVPESSDSELYSIRCALACQNRLLEEIRSLLAQNNTLLTAGNALLQQIEENTADSCTEAKT